MPVGAGRSCTQIVAFVGAWNTFYLQLSWLQILGSLVCSQAQNF